MRKAYTVALIGLAAFAPWWALKPEPPEVEPQDQPAQVLSVFDWHHDAGWFGGLSGLELMQDGREFYAVTDRGHLIFGTIERDADRITGVAIARHKRLVDQDGNARPFPHTDAEGLALDEQNRLYVSFEQAHRVLRYDTWDANAAWPSYTRAWRALPKNGGLEMLAVDQTGVLLAIPEGVASGAWEALVYRRPVDQKWQQAFTLPLDGQFVPVGGDFGPDGRLYILERDVYPFGFLSRVRSMRVSDTGFSDFRTELETPLGLYGNLEGISIWQDSANRIRLTMVSDDNFLPVLPSQIVEYVLMH
jgi:hypothetical protein